MARSRWVVAALCLVLVGCATAHKLGAISIGQTKEEVIAILGQPYTVSASRGAEYFHYGLFDSGYKAYMSRGQARSHYAVRFVGGLVEAYGPARNVIATPIAIERETR